MCAVFCSWFVVAAEVESVYQVCSRFLGVVELVKKWGYSWLFFAVYCGSFFSRCVAVVTAFRNVFSVMMPCGEGVLSILLGIVRFSGLKPSLVLKLYFSLSIWPLILVRSSFVRWYPTVFSVFSTVSVL